MFCKAFSTRNTQLRIFIFLRVSYTYLKNKLILFGISLILGITSLTGCDSLRKVTINKDSFDSFKTLFGDSSLPNNLEVVVTGEGELKQYQFEASFGVTKISLGNDIILNDRCFLDCRSLKEINIFQQEVLHINLIATSIGGE